MSSWGQIVFRRPLGGYRDLIRSYRLDVDGKECGKVADGESVGVEVEPGPHTVRARIDWTGSPDLAVEVVAGAEVHVDVFPSGGAFSFQQMLSRTSYLTIELHR